MAIIIENLNMPSTCTMCWISNICQDHIHDLTHIGYEKRLDDCPLRELVQCKDCKWYTNGFDWQGNEYTGCSRIEFDRNQTDYCSYGEIKEDE